MENLPQLVEAAPFALFVADKAGVIEWFNKKAEDIFGYSSEELVGKPIEVLVPMGVRGAHSIYREGYCDNPSNREMGARSALKGVCKDGSLVYVEVGLNAFHSPDGLKIIAAVRDVSAQKKLEEERRRLIEILELTTDFIGTSDMQGNLTYHNPAALATVGLSPDTDISSLHIKDMHPQAAAKKVLEEAIPEVLANGVWRGDNTLLHQDGTEIPVSQVLMAHRDRYGKPEMLSTIMRDMTEQKNREIALSQAMHAAEAASRAKSAFVANMSHEIRTPLNAVIGMMQLIRRTSLNERQQSYVEKAESSARVLLGILNDILDFSKIEAGKMVLEHSFFHLDELIKDIGVVLGSYIGDKQIELLFDIDPSLPAMINGDSLRIQQVLINLLGNAIKFTHDGEVVLTVQGQQCDETKTRIRFSIEDTGIGVSEENWLKIFDGFSQAEASTTRRFGGTGLGLAISNRLLDLMGSTLQGESDLGKGTRFWFDIETIHRGTVHRGTLSHRDPAMAQGLKVLLIDDNAKARDVLGRMLKSFAWQCVAVESGEAALQALQSPFDLVLLDWVMPGTVSVKLYQQLRARLARDNTPIIVMISVNKQGLLESEMGDDEEILNTLLVKPISPSTMFDAAVKALKQSGKLARDSASSSYDLTEELQNISILLVEDNAINQELARDLLEDEGAIVDTADNGREALECLRRNPHRYDLVLMDIQMPVMDGYEATRCIRNELALAELPIIAMTANVMQEDRAEALASGMNDHIGKPFDADDLIDTILKWAKPRAVHTNE